MRTAALVGASAPLLAAGMAASPMTKVLNLLKTMQAEVEKDMESDAAISKKLQCWAATNRKEKEAAIAQGEATIAETSAKITDLTATTEALKVTVAKGTKGNLIFEESLLT